MAALKEAVSLGRLPHVEEAPRSRRKERTTEPARKAVIERASRSLKELNDMLGCVTKELAEGDLDLADLIVPAP